MRYDFESFHNISIRDIFTRCDVICLPIKDPRARKWLEMNIFDFLDGADEIWSLEVVYKTEQPWVSEISEASGTSFIMPKKEFMKFSPEKSTLLNFLLDRAIKFTPPKGAFVLFLYKIFRFLRKKAPPVISAIAAKAAKA